MLILGDLIEDLSRLARRLRNVCAPATLCAIRDDWFPPFRGSVSNCVVDEHRLRCSRMAADGSGGQPGYRRRERINNPLPPWSLVRSIPPSLCGDSCVRRRDTTRSRLGGSADSFGADPAR